VRWYLLGMGSEKDLHSAHWHGKTVSDKFRFTDVIELMPGSMVTVDMLADNPGTWMFHCHVADHMEAGMMATYTIYQPTTRPCPIKFVSGSFWTTDDQFSLTVENISGKSIQSFTLESEHFLAPQYLRRPFQGHSWTGEQPVGPGQEQTLERKAFPPTEQQAVLGWVFMPDTVKFADGSVWRSEREGECFKVFWRDKDHPELDVLPPLQRELHLD